MYVDVLKLQNIFRSLFLLPLICFVFPLFIPERNYNRYKRISLFLVLAVITNTVMFLLNSEH